MESSYILQSADRKFNDLYLCYCGCDKCPPGYGFGPAVRPNYLIHYILEGKGRYQIGEKLYQLEAGQGFLIEPQVQTYYCADSLEPWTYLWIGFDGANAGKYLQDIGLTGSHPVFRCSYPDELRHIVMEMLEHNICTSSNQLLMIGLLYSFFSVLARNTAAAVPVNSDGGNQYVQQAVEFIQNNYAFALRVTDIADYVCVNRSYLYTLFKKHLNTSPQDYLTNYRITRAAELLKLTNLSVESVALSCGYNDVLVFSKAFKARKGIPPSKYRRQKNI